MLSELFNSTLQITPASKFVSLELSPTAPTGKAANDSCEECTDGTWKVFLLPCRFGFCLHFATGWQPAFRYAISLAFVCARNEICLEL